MYSFPTFDFPLQRLPIIEHTAPEFAAELDALRTFGFFSLLVCCFLLYVRLHSVIKVFPHPGYHPQQPLKTSLYRLVQFLPPCRPTQRRAHLLHTSSHNDGTTCFKCQRIYHMSSFCLKKHQTYHRQDSKEL